MQAHGAFSASNQNGVRRNNVGTAHRHVGALRLAFLAASTDGSAEGMLVMTSSDLMSIQTMCQSMDGFV